jgi:tRNA A-37 threonylcarbamoyl transferase component Bud32
VLGEIVGNFKIVAKLGRGGMGEVWVAEQQSVGTRVAIKMLREPVSTDSEEIQRFFNEARAVSRIPHAGITKIFDVGIHASGRPYLVMELLEGESIARRIARLGRLDRIELADLGRQIASVLDATHSSGITHRDLKPDNAFVIPDRELPRGERVKVLDFGIAKLTGTLAGASPGTKGILGTPAYMAPEQWGDASVVDWRADLYSLGCMLFEMACGRPPFQTTTLAEACARHLYDKPPRASSLEPSIPAQLDRVIDALLAKRPEDRPRSMHEVARTLDAVSRGIDVAAATVGESVAVAAPTVPPQRRSLGFVIVALVAIAAGAVGYSVATRDLAVRARADASAVTVATVAVDAPTPPIDASASLAADAAPPIDAPPPSRPPVVVHRPPPEEPEGTIDRDEVSRRLYAQGHDYATCLGNREPPHGRLVVVFKIGVDGRATELSATGADDELSACILAVVRRIAFPIPQGNPVKIIFPMHFAPSSGSAQ